MKKIAFTGFMVSMLFSSAFAVVTDSATLTTKDYVDEGFIYINNVKADKTSVYTKDQVYTKDESDSKYLTAVDVAQMDGTPYTAGDGISVNNHQVGLNVDAQVGSMYVYTSGGWVALPVNDQWNANTGTPLGDD